MTETIKKQEFGYIKGIDGSLIKIKGLEKRVRLYDLIQISKYDILGQVIQIFPDHIIAQCFESTFNLQLDTEVINLKEPLSMELAPGLISRVFDGIQRPLELAFEVVKDGTLERGLKFQSLSREKKWHFYPKKDLNNETRPGDIIGTVQETELIEHRIMVPPYDSGLISFIAEEGYYTIEEEIYRLKKDGEEKSFSMLQKWPITKGRPYQEKLNPSEPLITGMRAIDLLFPLAKGGTTAVPGGFGTGKTIIQQTIAKWCNADIIVFIGCGEPGNEIANILKQFSEIVDPKTNSSLFDHVVVIANTSNMPVSAREASLFSGVTIAEYYRDMGYDVAVLADSTSRWAESLREISGLLEEMPAEEGYPAYLPSKLSSFYERAGVVKALGTAGSDERTGSLTIIGTISPPAGDFSEPVTATTKRVVQTFWALDPKLAYLKHYPAIDWTNSYSKYSSYLERWWDENDIRWFDLKLDWKGCRDVVNLILSSEQDLMYIVQLVGVKNLQIDQRLDLYVAKLIKNGFLIQSAFDEIDRFTGPKKLLEMIKLILLIYEEGKKLLKTNISIDDVLGEELMDEILRMKTSIPNENFDRIEIIRDKLLERVSSLE
jgi:V/A-type H+-transporting ATPase subunit A